MPPEPPAWNPLYISAYLLHPFIRWLTFPIKRFQILLRMKPEPGTALSALGRSQYLPLLLALTVLWWKWNLLLVLWEPCSGPPCSLLNTLTSMTPQSLTDHTSTMKIPPHPLGVSPQWITDVTPWRHIKTCFVITSVSQALSTDPFTPPSCSMDCSSKEHVGSSRLRSASYNPIPKAEVKDKILDEEKGQESRPS